MAVNLEIKLNRSSKVYYEGEVLRGTVQVHATTEIKHDGGFSPLQLSIEDS